MTMASDFANNNTFNRDFEIVEELEKLGAEINAFAGNFNSHLAIFPDLSELSFSDKNEVSW